MSRIYLHGDKIIRNVVAILIVAGIIAAGFFWRQKGIIAHVSCKDCNVIIVSLDTLSGAHIPCNGYTRNTAPNLCAFAAKNMLFQHAYGNATYTLPGHVSIFTGLYPRTHKVMEALKDSLSAYTLFLPSILKENGYTTIFFMPPESPHLPRDLVYNRGIDTFLDATQETWAHALQLFEQKAATGEKTFLFLHTYAVHPPLYEDSRPKLYTNDSIEWMSIRDSDVREISKDFVEYFIIAIRSDLANGVHGLRYEGLLRSLEASQGDHERQKYIIEQSPAILEEYRLKYDPLIRVDVNNRRELSYLEAVYDQKIHEFDAGELQELLAFVLKDSIRKNTVVIITSDHGEEFGEHGYISHSTLYESNTRVVFVMAVPGVNSRTVNDYVQSADITPTILDLLGIRSGPFQGMSLQPYFAGGWLDTRLLVADTPKKQTLRLGKWKLFIDRSTGEGVPVELYDTEADPAEAHNLLFTHMALARTMMQRYRQFEKHWASIAP